MIFTYDKNGRVMFISDKKNKTDKQFQTVSIKPTKDEKEKIEQNYILYIKDKKLKCEKPDRIEQEEKITQQKILKEKLKKGSLTEEEKNKLLLTLLP